LGKSTLWYERLASKLQIPFVNADRLMLAILPEARSLKELPRWAQNLRDNDVGWMQVAQKGVENFVRQAIAQGVPFATETVFSHWEKLANGHYASKIDLMRRMQKAGYFVLLIFVGLSDAQLSIARVDTRVAKGGHAVDTRKLIARFPRTQAAISRAIDVADATLLTDNSRGERSAFTVCRLQMKDHCEYDIRLASRRVPPVIVRWLDRVCPAPAKRTLSDDR
jgi:predicted ABC-type ATPase